MSEISSKRLLILSYIYRVLLICLGLLVLVLIGGTIYGIFSQPTKVDRVSKDVTLNRELLKEGQTFKGIGLLRVSTSDPQPGIVILSVIFMYYPDDKAFSEELAFKIKDFREIIVKYLSSFSVNDLQNQDEEIIKTELLRQFNAMLQLGQIETLYFSDFMIVR